MGGLAENEQPDDEVREATIHNLDVTNDEVDDEPNPTPVTDNPDASGPEDGA